MFLSAIVKYCAPIPLSLVLSVIQIESSGNPLADVSGNIGLMQIRYKTALEQNCGVKKRSDLFNPEMNIRCGCTYLSKQFNRYGNYKVAVMAYNEGSVFYKGKLINSYRGIDETIIKEANYHGHTGKVLRNFYKICSTNEDCESI